MTRWDAIIRGLACGSIAFILGACANDPGTPGGLSAQSPAMEPSERAPGAVVWRAPGLDPARYTRFIISPVDIYSGSDTNWGDATEADKRALAAFMRQEFGKVLGEYFPITTAPGPNTARLELTLAGMSGNVPVASTLASVLPVGIVRNLTAGGQSATLSGSITYMGELYDSQSGERLAAFVTSKTPSALNIGATTSSKAAQRAAVSESARDLQEAIRANQKEAAGAGG